MNPYSFYHMPEYFDHSSQNMNSYIRVLHASPKAPAVDVYINNNRVIRDLKYKAFSHYLSLMPGRYNLKVYPAGQQTNEVINANLTVPQRGIYTLAVKGMLPDIDLLPLPDAYTQFQTPNRSQIRFVHLSPNAPAVDITLPDGTILFNDVAYGEYSDYIDVNAGTYILQVRPSGSRDVVLTVPNVELLPDTHYTAYAVGLVGEEPALEAILSTDGV